MAAQAISDRTADSFNGNRPLRVVPVIPAVPRQFEKKLTHKIVSGEQTRQASNASSQKDGPSQEDLADSPVKRESINESMLESEGRLAKHEMLPEGHQDVIPSPQDFGIEKHGHKLPPPFYPSKYCTLSPFALLPQLDTLQGQAYGSFTNNQIEQQADQFALAWSPIPHLNPTPPVENLPSPKESLYRGYGHIPSGSPSHRLTLSTDTIISPPEASDEDFTQTLRTSCTTPQNLPLDSTAPLQDSFYQGYTYGNVQPIFSPLARSASPEHSSTRIGHDFDLPAGDERKSYSCFPDQIEGELDSAVDSTLLSITTHNTIVQNQDSPYESARIDDSAGESGITSEFSFRHRASSHSSLGLENDIQQQNELHNRSKIDSPTRPIEYEAWRSSIFESLNETLNVSLNQQSLADHLLQQFDNDQFADCRLELSHKNDRFETAQFLLHSVIIAQSPLLKTSLNATAVQEDGIRHLQIQIHDRFITPAAIRAAFRVCYGESPLVFKGCLHECSSQSTAEVSISWMENALAFAKSGSLLGLEAVSYRGLQIASKVLNWENLETALSFLLGGGMETEWSLENDIRNASFVYATNQSSDHDNANAWGPEEVSVSVNAEKGAESEVRALHNSQKVHSPNMIDMLYQCLHFIIADFPEAWDLDVSCRPLADIDRLPTIPENRSPLSKSKLSLIQFGDLPSERAAKASDEHVVLSSVMLSMPYVFIKYTLDRVPESTRNKNLRDIVEERERRRRRVLKSKSISFSVRQAAMEYGHAGWEEFVNEDQNSRLSIERKWAGLMDHSIAKTNKA